MTAKAYCRRCSKEFIPAWLDALGRPSRFCGTCMLRNLYDGMNLPTPPDLLDRFTTRPTLSEAEYRRELEA